MYDLVRKWQTVFEYSFIEFNAEFTEKWLKTAKIGLNILLEKWFRANKNKRKNEKLNWDQFKIT